MTRRPRPLGDALSALRTRLAPASLLADVQSRWLEVAGNEIAREAQPTAERAGVVTVSCSSAVWASELSMMSADMLDRLNAGRPEGAAAVTELRFKVGG